MPGSLVIGVAMSMGKTPQQLLDELDDEPEYWRERFWIYVNAQASE
jgi:hypothetical protein